MLKLAAIVVSFCSAATGPLATKHTTVTYDAMDSTNKHIDVVYPDDGGKGKFPLIAYAHGFTDAGYSSYTKMMEELASWGYVVTAHLSCKEGCVQDCNTLLLDPPCYGHYYKEQLKVIEWAHSSEASAFPLNMTVGVAVAGHSMGGQATLFSAAYNASSHNIKAAAMHHGFTHTYPAALAPFLTFTGTSDITAPPAMAEKMFNADGAAAARGLVNKKGANHHEPTTDYNVKLAMYTVAWFKLHVDGSKASMGQDWDGLIYGTDAASVCGGGDGTMQECNILRA